MRLKALIRTPKIRKSNRKSSKVYYYKNKQKVYCRVKFYEAKKSGKLKQEPCVNCGNEKSEGHHSDYSKPLDVIWLCKIHHEQLHRELST